MLDLRNDDSLNTLYNCISLNNDGKFVKDTFILFIINLGSLLKR